MIRSFVCSLDEYGAEQRERLLQHWRSLQENIQPVSTRSSNSATSFLKNRSDGEDDEQAGGEWGICVNMPDTNVACDLPYYRANKQNIYRNFSTPKGHVLLINNSHFSSRTELRDRTGTAEDVQALDKLLRQLGYSPAEIHHNLSGIVKA
ncbi:hypothetical protein M3Y99_01363100 [Aphelenchoides fujianensis]|nr:hypothetical protein M3Y99_01363100 [Aphelenchoides fujianensis]